MMGRLKSDQGQLFYEFHLGDAVLEDHLVRKIDVALDPSWLRGELAAHYSSMGRPSIDPELMIRMLVVGYVFAIRSERLIRREVQVNLAYRWFCKLGIEDAIPDHSAFSRVRNERFREGVFSVAYSSGSSRRDRGHRLFGPDDPQLQLRRRLAAIPGIVDAQEAKADDGHK